MLSKMQLICKTLLPPRMSVMILFWTLSSYTLQSSYRYHSYFHSSLPICCVVVTWPHVWFDELSNSLAYHHTTPHHTTTVLWPFFRDHPG